MTRLEKVVMSFFAALGFLAFGVFVLDAFVARLLVPTAFLHEEFPKDVASGASANALLQIAERQERMEWFVAAMLMLIFAALVRLIGVIRRIQNVLRRE